MAKKPTYEELEQRIKKLKKEALGRKQAKEELRESEERYRSLVESTEDSIYLVDRECRYLFINKKHLSKLGLAIEKAKGRTYAEFDSEDNTREFVGKVEKVFETGKSLYYEYRSQRDGRYYLRTLSPVKEIDGISKAITVVSKNITEHKQAEEKIRQQQEELQIILDSVPVLVFYKDKEDKFIRVNKALAQAFNMSKEEIIAKTAAELSPVKDYWEEDKRVMETGIPLRNIIEPIETLEGKIWVKTDKIPYKDYDENIIGISSVRLIFK